MRFVTKKIKEQNSDTIICFIFEDDDKKSEVLKYVDELSNSEITKQIYEYKCREMAKTLSPDLPADSRHLVSVIVHATPHASRRRAIH